MLGGTGPARELAERLVGRPGLRVVSSLAGRLAEPRLPTGEVRIGGFGGVDALADWLAVRAPSLVVDATHPFAAQVSAHAVAAARRTGSGLLRLQRPGWQAQDGDRWRRVPTLRAAADLLPELARRPLLAVGRRGLAAFTAHPGCASLDLLVRCVEPPSAPLPPGTTVLLARGPFSVAGELALLREHRVDVLVTRDSGGTQTRAKLDAARELGLPVVVVDRPVLPPAPSVATVDEAVAWVRDQLARAGR